MGFAWVKITRGWGSLDVLIPKLAMLTLSPHYEPLSYNHTKRQAAHQAAAAVASPIVIHCDAPKSVPDPFPSVNPSVKTSKLPLGLFNSLIKQQLALKMWLRCGISIVLLKTSLYCGFRDVEVLRLHWSKVKIVRYREGNPKNDKWLHFISADTFYRYSTDSLDKLSSVYINYGFNQICA